MSLPADLFLRSTLLGCLAWSTTLAPGGLQASPPLAPWKDAEFALPAVLDSSDGGAYRRVDYRASRDIAERDRIDERKVHRRYVSLEPKRFQKSRRMRVPGGFLSYYAVGRDQGASHITVYLHGKGGSRHQGVDDWTFGGNFNRIKNLMVRNEGLYLCPDCSDFGPGGTARIKAILLHYHQQSPDADLFAAFGSAGGQIGYQLARDPEIAAILDGILMLGSTFDPEFLTSPAFRKRVPLYIGHGSADPVVPISSMEDFFRSIRAKSGAYPVRMVRFETGSHGTPIRMTDWKEVLNWMKSVRSGNTRGGRNSND